MGGEHRRAAFGSSHARGDRPTRFVLERGGAAALLGCLIAALAVGCRQSSSCRRPEPARHVQCEPGVSATRPHRSTAPRSGNPDSKKARRNDLEFPPLPREEEDRPAPRPAPALEPQPEQESEPEPETDFETEPRRGGAATREPELYDVSPTPRSAPWLRETRRPRTRSGLRSPLRGGEERDTAPEPIDPSLDDAVEAVPENEPPRRSGVLLEEDAELDPPEIGDDLAPSTRTTPSYPRTADPHASRPAASQKKPAGPSFANADDADDDKDRLAENAGLSPGFTLVPRRESQQAASSHNRLVSRASGPALGLGADATERGPRGQASSSEDAAEPPHATAGRTARRRTGFKADLSLPEVALCSVIRGYGDFEPLETDRLEPGQPLLLYAAVENFDSRLDRGQFRTQTYSVVELCHPNGLPIVREPMGLAQDLSKSRRSEYFLAHRWKLPRHLDPGRYVIRLQVFDVQSQQLAEESISVTVR